jgi:hypothetical protein
MIPTRPLQRGKMEQPQRNRDGTPALLVSGLSRALAGRIPISFGLAAPLTRNTQCLIVAWRDQHAVEKILASRGQLE